VSLECYSGFGSPTHVNMHTHTHTHTHRHTHITWLFGWGGVGLGWGKWRGQLGSRAPCVVFDPVSSGHGPGTFTSLLIHRDESGVLFCHRARERVTPRPGACLKMYPGVEQIGICVCSTFKTAWPLTFACDGPG